MMSQIVPADRESIRPSSSFLRGAALIKDVGRMQEIISVAVRHGFGEMLGRLNLRDNAIVSMIARDRENPQRSSTAVAERVRLALQELGPTFVKLGQILSTRSDLVPAEYVDQLQRLQDDVEPVEFSAIRGAIEAATEQPIEEVFAELDEVPVAAASVAQVHSARLVDGEEVAVKVLRPGVRQKVRADIGVMSFLARRLEATFAEARALNLSAMVDEFDRAMRHELDLRNEARNLKRFGRMFEGRPDVRIPAIIPELSGADALVMEFIRGDKITDAAERLDRDGRDRFVATCFDVLFTMILKEGLFHGDLHPGNVKLTDDGAVAIYDFGLVGRLTPMMRERVVDLLFALAQRDYQAVTEAFYDMAVRTRSVDLGAFAGEVADLLDHSFSDRKLAEIDLGSMLSRIGTIGVRFGLKVPSEYAMMIKAVLTVEGVGKAIAPEVDPVEAARPYLADAIRDRYSPDRLATAAGRTLLSMSRVVRRLPPAASELLRSIESGRMRFGVDLSTSNQLSVLLRGALSPVTDALLTGGFTVAGAMALSHGEGLIAGIPPVSTALFGLAALFLARVIFAGRVKRT